MNIGPFSVPVAPFILLVSIGVALFVAKRFGRGAPEAETAVLYSVAAGLLVSRLSFIAHYLPAYRGDLLKMADFRDLGFDAVPGVVAGAPVVAGFVMFGGARVGRQCSRSSWAA
jgi:prolipoprotein diacylglyceryltransferase